LEGDDYDRDVDEAPRDGDPNEPDNSWWSDFFSHFASSGYDEELEFDMTDGNKGDIYVWIDERFVTDEIREDIERDMQRALEYMGYDQVYNLVFTKDYQQDTIGPWDITVVMTDDFTADRAARGGFQYYSGSGDRGTAPPDACYPVWVDMKSQFQTSGDYALYAFHEITHRITNFAAEWITETPRYYGDKSLYIGSINTHDDNDVNIMNNGSKMGPYTGISMDEHINQDHFDLSRKSTRAADILYFFNTAF